MSVFLRATGFLLLIAMIPCASAFADGGTGCWFLRPEAAGTAPVVGSKSVLVAGYFRIFYPESDPLFADTDRDGMPDLIQKHVTVMEKSRHFLSTELGWSLPVTRRSVGTAELDVYFVKAGRRFTGAVWTNSGPVVVLNRKILNFPDFPALWIHQLAHAAQTQFRTDGDIWFFEATAGWMEGQFLGYSRVAQKAQSLRLAHPEISLTDVTPVYALGASRFLEMVSRPVKDVIRQTWQQWAYSRESRADEVLAAVLGLNHLPDLESYLQNFFLLHEPGRTIDSRSQEFTLAPFSAVVLRGEREQASGGVRLTFTAGAEARYSTALLFFSLGEKSGTLALKKGLTGASSVLIPFAGMDHYRFVVVNSSASWLQGTVETGFDPAIPGMLEYFRINAAEEGVQIEWKTSREYGVAFWNLYRLSGGKKELLNDFPIPAALHSNEGVRYLFLDSSDAAFYSLEAITSEGFASPLASAEAVP